MTFDQVVEIAADKHALINQPSYVNVDGVDATQKCNWVTGFSPWYCWDFALFLHMHHLTLNMRCRGLKLYVNTLHLFRFSFKFSLIQRFYQIKERLELKCKIIWLKKDYICVLFLFQQ